MSIVESITEADLIAAIEAAQQESPDNEPGAITSTQYAEHQGISERAALRRIKLAVRAGVLEPAKIRRTTIHGIRTMVNGYRLKN